MRPEPSLLVLTLWLVHTSIKVCGALHSEEGALGAIGLQASAQLLEADEGRAAASLQSSPGRLLARDGRFLSPVVRNGVPDSVDCEVTERCDSRNVCARVCTRGSVRIDPWLQAAVDYQWRLSRRQPLCFAQLLGTHNSAITLADGYGMHDEIYTDYLRYLGLASGDQRLQTDNQVLSLTDQLNLGVRFLELDVHWIQASLHISHCGGFHSPSLNQLVALLSHIAEFFGHPPVEWDAETVGCSPSLSSLPAGDQREFSDALSEVAAWLAQPGREGEFLVLYLDNQADLQTWGRVGELLGQVTAAIPPAWIVTPPELRNMTNTRGTTPSVDELVYVYGKRVLLMSGSDYGEEMSWLAFSHHSLCNLDEPLFRGFQGPPNCSFHSWRNDIDKPTMAGKMLRTPTCNLTYGPYNCSMQHGENIPQLDSQLLPAATSCGINVPAPDQLTPQLVQSYIWSWAPGHLPPQQPAQPPSSPASQEVSSSPSSTGLGEPLAREAAERPASGAWPAASRCVLMRASDGRWEVQPTCGGAEVSTFVACRRDAGPQHLPGAASWALVNIPRGPPTSVPCPTGFTASAPHTARENWELWQLLLRLQRDVRQRSPGQQQQVRQQQPLPSELAGRAQDRLNRVEGEGGADGGRSQGSEGAGGRDGLGGDFRDGGSGVGVGAGSRGVLEGGHSGGEVFRSSSVRVGRAGGDVAGGDVAGDDGASGDVAATAALDGGFDWAGGTGARHRHRRLRASPKGTSRLQHLAGGAEDHLDAGDGDLRVVLSLDPATWLPADLI